MRASSLTLLLLLSACGAPSAAATTPRRAATADPDARRPGPPRIGYVSADGALVSGIDDFTRAHAEYEHAMLDPTAPLPVDLDAVIVVGPGELDPMLVDDIVRFIDDGGGLAVMSSGGTISLEYPPTFRPSVAHATLLSRWDVEIERVLVLDTECGIVPLRTPTGVVAVAYPPAIQIGMDGLDDAHPITRWLDVVTAFFVSPVISPSGSTVMRASERAWRMAGRLSLEAREPRAWTIPRGGAGARSLAAAFEVGEGRVAVVGTETLIRDVFFPEDATREELRASMLLPHAIVAWLVEDASFEDYAVSVYESESESESEGESEEERDPAP